MSYRACTLWVDLAQIRKNTAALRAFLPQAVQLMAVVKADAYGHGALRCAKAMLEAGADSLAVALVEEGVALREVGITAPILVLGAPPPEGAEAVARHHLIQTVFSPADLVPLNAAGHAQKSPVSVHLKVDTGMGRLGVTDGAALRALWEAAWQLPFIVPSGAFTHFACADEPEDPMTAAQNERFLKWTQDLPKEDLLLHAANSAATLRYPWAHHGVVRVGIALYGAPGVSTEVPLTPALRWVCHATQVKTLPPDAPVSYGATFRTHRETRVMTLPVGYGDGYRRVLSGRAQVLVRGKRAPVIGRICMDQCMADVTEIPGVLPGDEVVLLGSQGAEVITPEEMARWMESIPYEVMLAPSKRVPRRYTGDA